MQHLSIIGFLGGDPEERVSKTGNKGMFFSVAVERYTQGEKRTQWYKIQVWDHHLFNITKTLHKGSLISVSGILLEPTIYKNQKGEDKVNLSIKAHAMWFLPFKKGTEEDDQKDLFVDI